MDQQAKIPTLKDSKKPQVKLRGLGSGLTLFDRFKQFKKKDLAFILAGLGTLFMAPLAEHFAMSPESADGTLQQGWGGGHPGGMGATGNAGDIFGGGNGPYEPGTTGLAPGGPTGGGSDVITPLNVRDPSALVMGPGATQQPPTNSVAPQTPPPTAPTHSDSDLKDALAASAAGVGAAAKKALLPVPKISLGNNALRGLGAVSGGSTAAASLGPISSKGLAPDTAAQVGGLTNVRPTANFRGVARGPGSGGGGAIENLKKAAENAAGAFNRTGAANGLANAASQAIPTGDGHGFGGLGQGGIAHNDKGPGGNSMKDTKNPGESLEFMREKMEMQKRLDLEWKKKEAGDTTLQMLKWRNKIGDGIADSLGKAMGTFITCPFSKGLSACLSPGDSGPVAYSCIVNGNLVTVPAEIVTTDAGCRGSDGKPEDQPYVFDGSTIHQCGSGDPSGLAGATKCDQVGGTAAPSGTANPGPKKSIGQNGGNVPTATDQILNKYQPQLAAMANACSIVEKATSQQTLANGAKAQNDPEHDAFLSKAKENLNTLAEAQGFLTGQPSCGVKGESLTGDNTVPGLHKTAIVDTINAMGALYGQQAAGNAVNLNKKDGGQALSNAATPLSNARKAWTAAGNIITDQEGKINGVQSITLTGHLTEDLGMKSVKEAVDTAQKDMASLAKDVKDNHDKLGKLLDRSEGVADANKGSLPSLNDLNENADGIQKKDIVDANKAIKDPQVAAALKSSGVTADEIKDLKITPAESGGQKPVQHDMIVQAISGIDGGDKAPSVGDAQTKLQAVVTAANELKTAAPASAGTPSPAATKLKTAITDANAAVTGLAKSVTDVRQLQLDEIAGIRSDANDAQSAPAK
jgi:hypothetical protein